MVSRPLTVAVVVALELPLGWLAATGGDSQLSVDMTDDLGARTCS